MRNSPAFFGDIGERAVAIVFVEAIGGIGGRIAQSRAGKHENVEPAVVIVIEERAAAAHGFNDVIGAFGMAADRNRFQPGARGNVGEACAEGQA